MEFDAHRGSCVSAYLELLLERERDAREQQSNVIAGMLDSGYQNCRRTYKMSEKSIAIEALSI
jgi:hypothetical protein